MFFSRLQWLKELGFFSLESLSIILSLPIPFRFLNGAIVFGVGAEGSGEQVLRGASEAEQPQLPQHVASRDGVRVEQGRSPITGAFVKLA